jgi:flagellum-specific ATP synthase
MPAGEMHGLLPNARVIPIRHAAEVAVGDALLGRVLDGEGQPLDGKPPPRCTDRVRLNGTPINPLSRAPIREPLDVGVRVINSLLTVGRGQRIGLFAGTGVGKSTLLGMMTRYTNADVIVVGLIGERGREVREFIENSQGKNVLLLMDSLTRFAQAQREIGLAVGEPPTTRGYPPSVFARLPQLVERAGNGLDGTGSITAFYTVLTEGDDPNDPIADCARGILDGHILLSRSIADAGIYPAIDIESSISRCAVEITDTPHQQLVRRFRQLFSAYQRNRDLISIGAYQKGSDARVDTAIAMWPRIEEFLKQDVREPADCSGSLSALQSLLTTN